MNRLPAKKLLKALVQVSILGMAGCSGPTADRPENGAVDSSPSSFTVVYDGNGNTTGSVAVDATVYTSSNQGARVLGAETLAKEGCTFGFWNTKADGTGASYFPGAILYNDETMPMKITLYATWLPAGFVVASRVFLGVTLVAIPAGLADVVIPAGIEDLGTVFSGNRTVLRVTIPATIKNLGQNAFANCARLTTIAIPGSVWSIGSYAFQNCASLTSVTIPEGVTTIGTHAFENCTALTTVTLPSSLQFFDKDVFISCSHLSHLSVSPSNPRYFADASGVLFDKGMTLLIMAPQGLSGTYTIPDTVTNIGSQAFQLCTRLDSVTIPRHVVSMGSYVFQKCTNLATVTMETTTGPTALLSCTPPSGSGTAGIVATILTWIFEGGGTGSGSEAVFQDALSNPVIHVPSASLQAEYRDSNILAHLSVTSSQIAFP